MKVIEDAVKSILTGKYSEYKNSQIEYYEPETYPALCSEPGPFASKSTMIDSTIRDVTFERVFYYISERTSNDMTAFEATVKDLIDTLSSSQGLGGTSVYADFNVIYLDRLPMPVEDSELSVIEDIAKITITGKLNR